MNSILFMSSSRALYRGTGTERPGRGHGATRLCAAGAAARSGQGGGHSGCSRGPDQVRPTREASLWCPRAAIYRAVVGRNRVTLRCSPCPWGSPLAGPALGCPGSRLADRCSPLPGACPSRGQPAPIPYLRSGGSVPQRRERIVRAPGLPFGRNNLKKAESASTTEFGTRARGSLPPQARNAKMPAADDLRGYRTRPVSGRVAGAVFRAMPHSGSPDRPGRLGSPVGTVSDEARHRGPIGIERHCAITITMLHKCINSLPSWYDPGASAVDTGRGSSGDG